MASAARQPLGGWRNESCAIPVSVPGVDFAGADLRMQVRLGPDTPGAALLSLGVVSSADALGLRWLAATTDGGVPTSHFVIQVPKAAMQGLPYSGEAGEATVLAYALQIAGVTRLFGSFVALASAIDSDAAPAARPAGTSARSDATAPSGVVLTIGDGGVSVSVDGADLLAPLITAASTAASAAADAVTLAGRYANATADADIPGAPAGARSARFWADRTATQLGGFTDELADHGARIGANADELAGHEARLSSQGDAVGVLQANAYPAGANIAVRGNLPSYDPTQFQGQGSGNVQASSDPVFAGFGCGFEVTNFGGSPDTANFSVDFPRRLRPGQWAGVSVLVRSSDGTSWPAANASTFRALFFDAAGGQFARPLGGSYEQIDATHRRYYLAAQNNGTTAWTKVWICVYAQGVAFSGFAAAIADRRLADVTWADFDPLGQVYPAGANIAPNGNLPSADQTMFQGLGSGALQASADPLLTGFGCVYEVAGFTATSSTANFIVTFPRRVRPGQWAVSSVIVRSPDGTSWPAPNSPFLRTIYFNTNGGQDLIALGNNFDQLDATHRRYHVAVQNTGVFDWFKAFICVWGQGMAFSGFAAAVDSRRIADVAWERWDPFDTAAQNKRLDGVEGRLPALEAATVIPQATPDLLVQSSYHLVQGRPLRLLRDGLTSYRELVGYDIAALNVNGIHVAEAFASPVMTLDGAEFFGDGFFRAKARNRDTLSFFQSPTYFYSAPATRTGTLRFHQIGDSLTYRGTTKAVYDRLAAAGLSVTMLGTVRDASNDNAGGIGEGRPNWKAANYTFASLNTDFGAPFYEVYPLRPNGGSGLTISASVSGGAVTSVSVSGGTGYPPGTWHVVFGDPVAGGQSGIRARGTVTVNASGVPTSIAITNAGAGYTAAPTGNQLVASYAEYLALDKSGGYGPRWRYNPYLRPATSAEVAANDPRIQNGYVFDFGFYVTNLLGGTMPDQVAVVLGMNDLLKGGTPATTFAAIRQIVTAIRAATSTAPIAIGIVGQASTAVWASFVALTRLLMGQYRGQEAGKLFLLPLFQVVDDKFTYDNEHDLSGSTSAVDGQTGMQTVTISDATHFNDIGRAQAAEMIFAWAMNRIGS